MGAVTLSQLLERRNVGHVRVGAVRTYPGEHLSAALARLGVTYSGEQHREIDAAEARRMLTSVFAEDLAYRKEIMPGAEAELFADFVLRDVFPPDSKLLTNIVFNSKELFRGDYGELFMGTDATFAVGVVAQTESVVACVWVEDED